MVCPHLSVRGWTLGCNVRRVKLNILEINCFDPVPPMMDVPSQLVGAHVGGNVTLKCRSQAFPASINYWVRGAGETVTSGMGSRRLWINNDQHQTIRSTHQSWDLGERPHHENATPYYPSQEGRFQHLSLCSKELAGGNWWKNKNLWWVLFISKPRYLYCSVPELEHRKGYKKTTMRWNPAYYDDTSPPPLYDNSPPAFRMYEPHTPRNTGRCRTEFGYTRISGR